MNMPNKVTLVAAAIYAVSPNPEEKRKPLWTTLTDEQKKPFNTVSEFLAGYAHGSDFHALNRAKAAAAFETQAAQIADSPVTANADTAVDLFLTISALLG